MKVGKTGYGDLSGSEFVARVFWKEMYNETTAVSVLQITDVQMKVTDGNFVNTWYPGGTCAIDDQTVCTLDYNNPATHIINATESFTSLTPTSDGTPFPWTSGSISHEPDGSKSVTIDLNLSMYGSFWESSWGPYPKITASVTVELTKIARGTGDLFRGGKNLRVRPCLYRNGKWHRLQARIYRNKTWRITI